MKPYPKYKDSGVEWIGEVPEHWEVKRLKYVATINPSKENSKISKDSDELVTFLPMEKVNEDGTFATDLRRPINELWNGFTYFEELDTIFAKITPCFENGKGAYLINLGSSVGFGSTEFHVLREIANISISKYLYYITRFDLFRKTGESLMIGVAGQKRVPSTFAENFLIGIPPVLEQQSITAYLDHKTVQIDNFVSKKQKLIKLLKEERAAIINQAVTKGLNPDAPMKDSGIDWLGEIPEKWEVKKGRYLFEIVSGYAPEQIDFSDDGTETYLRVDDLNENGNGFFLEFGKARCNLGPIPAYNENILLFPKRGAAIFTNKVRITAIQCLFDTNLMGLNIDEKIANTEFIAFCLLARRLDDIADTSTVPQINNKHIYPLPFPYPPLEEQLFIVKTLNKRIEGLDLLIHKVDHSIQLLKEFRTALISEVVTGKIDVRDEELK